MASTAPRPIWEGHLRLSLVTCPVALYSATTRANDVSFHLIHPKTNNRIRMIPHDPELGEVRRDELVKGYEVSKDKYVVLDKEDLEAVRLPSTRTIEIERFVDAADIDRIYWNDPYYLAPSGKTGVDAYVIIRHAMETEGKVGLGRVVMHTRERLVALEPRGRGILVTTLRSRDEIRAEAAYFDDIPAGKPDPRMLEIAAKIIEQQADEFDPKQFTDRYEDALRALIREKQKGHKPVSAPAPDDEKVVDLMEALKRSLKGGGATGARAARFLGTRAPARRKRARARSAG